MSKKGKRPVGKKAQSKKTQPAVAKEKVAEGKGKTGKERGAGSPVPRVERNPYRAGSNYGLAFDLLYRHGKDKPVSRKELLTKLCEASGKDEKHGTYDLAVVLSPTKEGTFHKSASKASLAYYVEKLENGLVQLHLR